MNRDDVLLQEYYAEEPWKMLVCCIMLNQTGRKQVDSVLDAGFFDRFGRPDHVIRAQPSEVIEYIRPLGLQNRRAGTLHQFSIDWKRELRAAKDDGEEWPDSRQVYGMAGVGDYALESYQIFVLGKLDGVRSGDKEITAWAERKWEEHSGSCHICLTSGSLCDHAIDLMNIATFGRIQA